MIDVFVPGIPAPQGSKRHVGGGRMIESSKKLKPWREAVAAATADGSMIPKGEPVNVWLDFVLPRPKSAPKRFVPAVKRPDIDKLARAVLDGITGTLIEDDSQVVHLSVTKNLQGHEFRDRTGVHVGVMRMP